MGIGFQGFVFAPLLLDFPVDLQNYDGWGENLIGSVLDYAFSIVFGLGSST